MSTFPSLPHAVTERDLGRVLAALASERSDTTPVDIPLDDNQAALMEICRERLAVLQSPEAVEKTLQPLQRMHLSDPDNPLEELVDLLLLQCVLGLPEGACDRFIRFLNHYFPAFLVFSETMRSYLHALGDGSNDGIDS